MGVTCNALYALDAATIWRQAGNSLMSPALLLVSLLIGSRGKYISKAQERKRVKSQLWGCIRLFSAVVFQTTSVCKPQLFPVPLRIICKCICASAFVRRNCMIRNNVLTRSVNRLDKVANPNS